MGEDSMKIRKQENKLTLDDINQFPVWEFALDEETFKGQNEKTLKPYLSNSIDPAEAYLLVRATFSLSNGSRCKGFIKPFSQYTKRLSPPIFPYDLNPVIITDKGQIRFCYGTNKPKKSSFEKNYRWLGAGPEFVFPIEITCDVDVKNSITSGILDGFLYFASKSLDFFKVTKDDVKSVK
jgi:hypothetical protein